MSVPFQQSSASQQEPDNVVLLLDKSWEDVQQRTFTKWVNTKLALESNPAIGTLADLSSGVPLIQLLETIGDTDLGKYNKTPRIHLQRVENANKALEFIKFRGVNLTNIGAEDIADGNMKLLLGLVWTIILRFTIADISQEGLTAKEGLLLWCQRKTAPYKEVNVQDFTMSWKDGLAFCALIHRHRPDLLDFDSLDKNDPHANTALAFEIAEKHVGIPKLLDVADVCDMERPDERSVMTYVAQYFHAFSALGKIETAGRRVAQFAEVMQSVWEMEQNYEERVGKLIAAIHDRISDWQGQVFSDNYVDAKQHSIAFTKFKGGLKREWVVEKRDLDSLLGNIQTKLRTYGLVAYIPPENLTPEDLDKAWHALGSAESAHRMAIGRKIHEIKENLMRKFAQQANELQDQLNEISSTLAGLEGELAQQQDQVKALNRRMIPLQGSLKKLELLDKQCIEANVEENEHTAFTLEDLQFDFAQVQLVLSKKLTFIENQMVARTMTNLTPGQLEEFESSFRHFDRDNTNTLEMVQFKACLASLGINYSDDELQRVFQTCAEPGDRVTFERFVNYMVGVTEDRTTPEQLRESFKVVAADKPYVTEMDLRISGVSLGPLQYLSATMPLVEDGASASEERLDFVKYLDTVFA